MNPIPTRTRAPALLPGLRASLLVVALSAPHAASAAGFHLVKVDGLYGTSELDAAEAGLGVSLYSEELSGWITMGSVQHARDHRVKEWWFESRYRGPVMGTLPASMEAVGFEESERSGWAAVLVPFRSWRFGSDHSSQHWLEWDWSNHVVANLPGLWGRSHRSVLFGPTLGAGVNLTWWEGWKGYDEHLVNTGKVTAEAGWLAGVTFDDVVYSQARALLHYDAFGTHQHNLNLSAMAGVFLGRLGIPFGLEIAGELDRGDDTWDTNPATIYSLRAALSYRMVPRDPEESIDSLLESLREIVEQERAAREATPHAIKPPPGAPPALEQLESKEPTATLPPAVPPPEEPDPPPSDEPEPAAGSSAEPPLADDGQGEDPEEETPSQDSRADPPQPQGPEL